MPDLQTIRERFDQISDRFEQHAALEQAVGERLLERTSFRRLDPERILDLGCGTGRTSQALKREFRKARVIGLDSSAAMLTRLRDRSGLMRPLIAVLGDNGALPFAENSFDLVLSNLAVFWTPEPMKLYAEVRRVLRPEGMFLFSTLGPGTMAELADAWAKVDGEVQVPAFPDLMDVGNALVSAGFREPVMDMEVITLSYRELGGLFRELEATGKSLLVLNGGRWQRRLDALAQAWGAGGVQDSFPLSFEIVYGTAFGPEEGQPVRTQGAEIATFSVDSLRRSRPPRRR